MMTVFFSWSIILLCFISLVPFYKTKKILSFWGILLFITLIVALLTRVNILNSASTRFIDNSSIYFSLTVIFSTTLVGVILLSLFRRKKKMARRKIKYIFKLLPLYIVWGILQQLLFQVIFFETALFLFDNFWIPFSLSLVFFGLFHLRMKLRKYYLAIFLFGIVSTIEYYLFGNAPILGIQQAILATYLFTFFIDEDQIARRF